MTERAREISPQREIVVGQTTIFSIDKRITLWYNIGVIERRKKDVAH